MGNIKGIWVFLVTTTDLVVLDTIIAEAHLRITDEADATIVPDLVAILHVSKPIEFYRINFKKLFKKCVV